MTKPLLLLQHFVVAELGIEHIPSSPFPRYTWFTMDTSTSGLLISGPQTLSSPRLKCRNARLTKIRRKFWHLLRYMLAACIIIATLLRFTESSTTVHVTDIEEDVSGEEAELHRTAWNNTVSASSSAREEISAVGVDEFTAVLPISPQSLLFLSHTLATLISHPNALHSVVLLVPETLLASTRRVVRNAPELFNYVEVTLRPYPSELSSRNILEAAATVSTNMVLILDEDGLNGLDSSTRSMLLNPLSTPFPLGPRGHTSYHSGSRCISPHGNDDLVAASYLVPPFTAPSAILGSRLAEMVGLDDNTWVTFGKLASRLSPISAGGFVGGSSHSNMSWCATVPSPNPQNSPAAHAAHDITHLYARQNHFKSKLLHRSHAHASHVDFAILAHTLSEFQSFSVVACSLQRQHHNVRLYLEIAPPDLDPEDGIYTLALQEDCRILCSVPFAHAHSDGAHGMSEWLDTFDNRPPHVIISALEQNMASALKRITLESPRFINTTLVQLPPRDLVHCSWMTALTLDAWKSERDF